MTLAEESPYDLDDDAVFLFKEVFEVGDCDSCGADIGVLSEDEYLGFWVDWHRRGTRVSWRSSGRYSHLCEKCHDELTKPLPPIPDRIVGEPEDWQPIVGGWVVCHTRSPDQVFFGPFATLKEVDEWLENVGTDRGVRGYLIPLVSPASNPDNLWHEPVRPGQIVTIEPAKA